MRKINWFLVLLLGGLFLAPNVQAKRIGYYFYFDPTNKHQYEDENVRVYMVNSGICVSNKTDKIIYVDKGNSYATLNGKHERMFTNRVTTSGTSSGSGIGVNLGVVSPYLRGITVSGNSGAYNQTATYEERILAIPPHSWIEVWTWKVPFALMAQNGHIKDNGSVAYSLTPRSRYIEPTGKKIKLTKGFVRTFDLNTSPLRYKTLITYALSEDMKDAKEVSTDENYLKAIVADSYKGWSDYRVENLPYCQPFMTDTENYTCWLRYKEGARLEDMEKVGVYVVGIPVAFYTSLWLIFH